MQYLSQKSISILLVFQDWVPIAPNQFLGGGASIRGVRGRAASDKKVPDVETVYILTAHVFLGNMSMKCSGHCDDAEFNWLSGPGIIN